MLFERLARSRTSVLILGYAAVAAAVLVLLGAFFTGAMATSQREQTVALIETFFGFAYLTPGIYLLRYAGAIKRAVASPGTSTFSDALRLQLRLWRFWGILMLLLLSAITLTIVAVLIIPFAARLFATYRNAL